MLLLWPQHVAAAAAAAACRSCCCFSCSAGRPLVGEGRQVPGRPSCRLPTQWRGAPDRLRQQLLPGGAAARGAQGAVRGGTAAAARGCCRRLGHGSRGATQHPHVAGAGPQGSHAVATTQGVGALQQSGPCWPARKGAGEGRGGGDAADAAGAADAASWRPQQAALASWRPWGRLPGSAYRRCGWAVAGMRTSYRARVRTMGCTAATDGSPNVVLSPPQGGQPRQGREGRVRAGWGPQLGHHGGVGAPGSRAAAAAECGLRGGAARAAHARGCHEPAVVLAGRWL